MTTLQSSLSSNKSTRHAQFHYCRLGWARGSQRGALGGTLPLTRFILSVMTFVYARFEKTDLVDAVVTSDIGIVTWAPDVLKIGELAPRLTLAR